MNSVLLGLNAVLCALVSIAVWMGLREIRRQDKFETYVHEALERLNMDVGSIKLFFWTNDDDGEKISEICILKRQLEEVSFSVDNIKNYRRNYLKQMKNIVKEFDEKVKKISDELDVKLSDYDDLQEIKSRWKDIDITSFDLEKIKGIAKRCEDSSEEITENCLDIICEAKESIRAFEENQKIQESKIKNFIEYVKSYLETLSNKKE